MSKLEELVRRFIEEGLNAGDLRVVDELVQATFVEHQNYGPDHATGPEGVKAVIVSLHRAFSDFTLTIDDLVVAGDSVWLRLTGSGTNDGPYMGQAPTGRRMRVDVFDVLRVEAGRIVEHWGVPDRLGALFQLGLAAPPSAVAGPPSAVAQSV